MGRPRPLTIPEVTLIPTFKGLPMAMTGSPTPTEFESPSVSGLSAFRGASTCISATSVEGSCPTTSASLRTPSANLAEISSAPSTTCWLVTICPASSITNPDPPAGPASEVAATSTLTTPRRSRVDTSRTEELSVTTGVPAVPLDDLCGGATSFMVTLPDLSSRPYTPTKRKSAVTRPPIIAETSAVSAVLKMLYFLDPLRSRSRGPGAELYDIPAVYLPPAILLHKIPSPLVMLDLPCQRGLSLARDGRLGARDLSVRPLDKHHLLHLVEGTLEGGLIRERALSIIFAEKPGGLVVFSRRGRRVEIAHCLLCALRREPALPRSSRRAGRGRSALLICVRALILAGSSIPLPLVPTALRVVPPGILVSTRSEEVWRGEGSYHDEHRQERQCGQESPPLFRPALGISRSAHWRGVVGGDGGR